jgi:tetratricopeptide (TPR) repeat protein
MQPSRYSSPYCTTLALVAHRRAPSPRLPVALDGLFAALAASAGATEAEATEARIWALWMHHPHRRAARDLDLASTEIAGQCHDLAETRLARLLRADPDYAEAWNKQATLFYLQERDQECLASLHHTLALEPRHFGALCSLAEVLAGLGDAQAALFAFEAALRVHPHLPQARHRVAELRDAGLH